MERNCWLGAAAGALAIGLMSASALAAPPSAGGIDARVAAGGTSGVHSVHWDGPYYGYYHYPRRHYRHYYRYYRPYRHYYYGYGPGYGYYYRRGWW